jgi:DNA topoisomerase-1
VSKNLIIVESPTKVRTIKRYLKGKAFSVVSSNGHVKDLPKKKLGVDVKKHFTATYEIIQGKSKILKKIKKEAEKASNIFLATDPDREGEAIAFHIVQEINERKVPRRVLFYEITKSGVEEALQDPGYLNMNLVKSQQARRILDRLVGYKVSPYLWKTVRGGLSAGRVQTVALRLICEREEKIEKFVKKEYWTLDGIFKKIDDGEFKCSLKKIGKKKPVIESSEAAEELIESIKKESFSVSEYKEKNVKRSPPPPLITSSLQQEASKRFNFSAKRTMMVAQQLYEGVEIGEEGPVGLITYMRTDSFRISEKEMENARKFIKNEFGDRFLPVKKRRYKSKEGAQGAHEAIRPTDVKRRPESIAHYLNKGQLKIYTLIWERFLASQMANAVYKSISVDVKGGKFLFRATTRDLIFKGFIKLLGEKKSKDEFTIPKMGKGESVELVSLHKSQHFTEPPNRFTEGFLVKELEAKGIGRPSTYAPIISTIRKRGYVEKRKRALVPTKLGRVVIKILIDYFKEIFSYDFTKEMEEELDEIEEGKKDILAVLNEFYEPFSLMLKKVGKEVPKIKKKIEEKTDAICEVCGRPMVVKWGRYGRFLACSGYPECKNTKQINEKKVEGKCPKCGGNLIIRHGRYGRFISCENYPKCDYSTSVKTGVKCPNEGCNGELVERRTKKGKVFYGCSNYPKCKFAVWDKPVPIKCPTCSNPFLVEKYGRDSVYYKCTKCKAKIKREEIKDNENEEEDNG